MIACQRKSLVTLVRDQDNVPQVTRLYRPRDKEFCVMDKTRLHWCRDQDLCHG